MRAAAVGWVEVDGQRLYITRAVRDGLAALTAGPAALPAIYPALQPGTATRYIYGLQQQGLVRRVSPRRGSGPPVYALTAQGHAARAALAAADPETEETNE
jgi:hypothetical protein